MTSDDEIKVDLHLYLPLLTLKLVKNLSKEQLLKTKSEAVRYFLDLGADFYQSRHKCKDKDFVASLVQEPEPPKSLEDVPDLIKMAALLPRRRWKEVMESLEQSLEK